MIGDLLGDGHLRFTHRDEKGQPKGNALYAMTLKEYDYIYYLWSKVYAPICTLTPIRPWPNPKTGKTPTQYAFNTKSLPSLTELHREWYVLNSDSNIFTKIVPLNISEHLSSKGLAHLFMGDGYWDKGDKTVVICTDNFTLTEVNLLLDVLINKFGLEGTIQRRVRPNKVVCWRIRFSSKLNNINRLRFLVKPQFIPSMLYKLNLSQD